MERELIFQMFDSNIKTIRVLLIFGLVPVQILLAFFQFDSVRIITNV